MADRVRRVSFLVDLRAGTAKERAQVRLVLRRVLTHLSRQSPAPPRWSFRFYDSALTPQRFDARMTALAKASAGTDDKLPTLRRDEFHACTPDVIAAVVRAYDQSVELYNADADDDGGDADDDVGGGGRGRAAGGQGRGRQGCCRCSTGRTSRCFSQVPWITSYARKWAVRHSFPSKFWSSGFSK